MEGMQEKRMVKAIHSWKPISKRPTGRPKIRFRRLQVLQSKCLRVIGNYPRCTPIPCLHTTLNITPISDCIYHLTDKFFGSCPAHPNPLIHSIGNYSLVDLHRQYKKYIHKRSKHILLSVYPTAAVFFLCTCFSLLYS